MHPCEQAYLTGHQSWRLTSQLTIIKTYWTVICVIISSVQRVLFAALDCLVIYRQRFGNAHKPREQLQWVKLMWLTLSMLQPLLTLLCRPVQFNVQLFIYMYLSAQGSLDWNMFFILSIFWAFIWQSKRWQGTEGGGSDTQQRAQAGTRTHGSCSEDKAPAHGTSTPPTEPKGTLDWNLFTFPSSVNI